MSKTLCLLLCWCAGTALAQPTLRTLPKRFVADEFKNLTSPFRKSSYTSDTVKKYVIPFGLITGALIVSDRHLTDTLPNTRNQSVWSGRVSQFGAWYTLTGISGGTYLAGKFSGNARAQETGLLAMESLGHAQVAVFALKQITNRQRPVDGRGSFWAGGTSFPSGHAAGAFSVATVFAYEYQNHRAVPILAYSAATAVALSRVGARRHWASDIFAGSTLGFMMGRATFKRHHATGPTSKLIPQVQGPGLAWNF